LRPIRRIRAGVWQWATNVRAPLLFRSSARSKALKQRQKCLFEADDGPGLVGYEIAATGEKELQLGERCLAWLQCAEVSGLMRAWSAM
jgi:hypothetical protein